MPEECNRKGASPTESAAAQDWIKGTLWSWYIEAARTRLIVGISVVHVTYIERGAGSAGQFAAGPGLNAGGTAGNV